MKKDKFSFVDKVNKEMGFIDKRPDKSFTKKDLMIAKGLTDSGADRIIEQGLKKGYIEYLGILANTHGTKLYREIK